MSLIIASVAMEVYNIVEKCKSIMETGCYSVKWPGSKETSVLHHKYVRHFHKTNTTVFTIVSTIKQAELQVFVTIIAHIFFVAML